MIFFHGEAGVFVCECGREKEYLFGFLCAWDGNTKRHGERKPGFMFVCLFVCIICIMCLTLWVFVSFRSTAACVCACTDTQIAYLPRTGWLYWLVLGTRPDCPSANITRPKCTRSTSWYTQIHTNTKLRGTMLLDPCQCSPKRCWHTECLYTHATFFHRLSYQFNQEMKNKRHFCAAVFALDKWFILEESVIKAMPAVSISSGRWLIQEPGWIPVAPYSPLWWTVL